MANRVFHRYTYNGAQMCMRETYRNGTADAIVFTRPDVTRVVQVVPGGGGATVYTDSDGTQDAALIDPLGKQLFMHRTREGYLRNLAKKDWENVRHSGILKTVNLPMGPYLEYLPWHMQALEPDFLMGRRGTLGSVCQENCDPGLLLPVTAAPMGWWDNVLAKWDEDPGATIEYVAGGAVLIVGGVLVTALTAGAGAPLAAFMIGGAISGFGATGAATHDPGAALEAGAIGAVAGAVGGATFGYFAPAAGALLAGVASGMTAGFTGGVVGGLAAGQTGWEALESGRQGALVGAATAGVLAAAGAAIGGIGRGIGRTAGWVGQGLATGGKAVLRTSLAAVGRIRLPYRVPLTLGVRLSRFFAAATRGYVSLRETAVGSILRRLPLLRRLNWEQGHVFLQQKWWRPGGPSQLYPGNPAANVGLRRLGNAGWNLMPMPRGLNNLLSRHPIASAGFAGLVGYATIAEVGWAGRQVYRALSEAYGLAESLWELMDER